jgi:hypothetical protein
MNLRSCAEFAKILIAALLFGSIPYARSANRTCEHILLHRGEVSTKILFAKDGVEIVEARGVPSRVQLVPEPHTKVFRQFIQPKYLADILKEQRLVAGPMSYVVKSNNTTTYFVDLTGIFLTDASFAGSDVGVSKHHDAFIDLRVHEGTQVLQLEPGIYLIPGPPGVRQWLREKYAEYKATGVMSPEYRPNFEKWDREGMEDRLEVKITIVNSGK